ncbi:hypothetical protein GMDG_02084 [Pseudogymnoascus destructans 20631-21]|uniref:Uncharacterized protein n=1 Tax=Pseudogymnoascus destructans (strain ATCC MYA-4855 / 20631-21) TaxID=658429 RepID=L8FZS2_PSED2|nr:hypothetical protein GMDG_02084 [Pseudogymnoascus destructans 20631-21]
MSGSSAGLPLRSGSNARVKSEPAIDSESYLDPEMNMDGVMEDTPEASVGEDARSSVEETEGEKKLRRKREYNRVA